MTAAPGRWDDLALRVISALAMIAIGYAGAMIGGWTFLAMIALIVAGMIWELSRMLAPEHRRTAIAVAVAAGLGVILVRVLPTGYALPLLFLPAILALIRFETNRRLFAIYAAVITLAGIGLVTLREDYGLIWMLWLVLVVVITDVAGYFAGRLIGGPKFWPKVSPKKTWSGTVAGWLGAVAVAIAFASQTEATFELIGISVALSMASQIGDLSESAIKRHAGVKDSSALIPGHGGMMDRFDGMLAASVALLLIEQIANFPPLPAG